MELSIFPYLLHYTRPLEIIDCAGLLTYLIMEHVAYWRYEYLYEEYAAENSLGNILFKELVLLLKFIWRQ